MSNQHTIPLSEIPTRSEVRHCVQADRMGYMTGESFDRFLAQERREALSGYVRKPSREELANTIADTDALTGIGMRWFPSGELTPQAYAIADAILTLLERTDR